MKPTLIASALAAALLVGCQANEEPAQSTTDNAAPAEPAATEMHDHSHDHAASDISLETFDERFGYMVGMTFGGQLASQNLNVPTEVVIAGLRDALSGKEPAMTQEQILATMKEFEEKQRALQEEALAAQQAQQQKYEDYLEANKANEGVVETESGLQYRIIEEGTGAAPVATDVVRVNYVGRLIDGTEFDASAKHGGPAEFPLNGVIPGWTEGLQQVKEGGKIELTIPGDLAYGPGGTGQIPPNATLIFEVELLEIVAPEAPEAPEAPAEAQ